MSTETGKERALRIFVQKIPKLPTLPSVAERILGMVDDDSASVESVVDTIKQDPAIAAKVLSFANAAFYGGGNPVLSVRDAVMKIGFKNIRSIALGISLMTIFSDSKDNHASAYLRIFRHSLAVAFIANQVACKSSRDLCDKAFVGGLLHDIGQLVINKYFNEEFARIMDELPRAASLVDAERTVLGITHSDIGLWIADKWNLPKVLLDVIEFHHAPAEARDNKPMVALVHIANAIAGWKGFGMLESGLANPFDNSALAVLGLSEQDLEEISSSFDGDVFPPDLLQ
ncbi:MAG TPA: HDOD domain-containing protein [Dissulfurispiraceae bacterium]|nr:HDOD domain-containing protein [Dissulfurispiraceae bacterium]